MPTLQIEHAIMDLDTWLGAFNRFADARRTAGARAQHVRQPVDDDKYICVSLEFDTVGAAAAFKGFLETNVWSNPEASPALEGAPRARILTDVDIDAAA